MDPYNEDLDLQNKGYAANLTTNELSSLEQDHEAARRHFGVDEPLEVQLRFELGSLVDSHVLIDTDGPRESHWDFVRQEQGRFQASSDVNNTILSHNKQDDLKSFDNCESWPRSASQVDTHLFIDAQDDVSMITDAFEGKDKSMADLVGDDRGVLLPSTYRHSIEVTAWIGADKEVLEAKGNDSCMEDANPRNVESSHIPIETFDARSASESSAEYKESHQSQVHEHKENHEARHLADDVVQEPLPRIEQSSEVEAASITACKSAVSFEEANRNQELLPECSQHNLMKSSKDFVDSNEHELASIDDVEGSQKTETAYPTEEVNRIVKEKPKMDTISIEVDAEAKANDQTFLRNDQTLPTISEVVAMESDSDLVSRTSLAQKIQELVTEPVIQSSDLLVDTCVTLKTGKSFIAQGGSCLDTHPGGSCLESESASVEPVEKQDVLSIQSTEMGTSSYSVSKSFQETTVLDILKVPTTIVNVVASHEGLRNLDKGIDVAREILNAERQAISEPSISEPAANSHSAMPATIVNVVASHEGLRNLDKGIDVAREILNVERQAISEPSISEPAANSHSAMPAIAAVPAEVCLLPATHMLKQGGSYESDAEVMEKDGSVNSLDQAEAMQGISAVADLSVARTHRPHQDINKGQSPATDTPQKSGNLEAADNNMDPKPAVNGVLEPKHSDEPNNTLSIVNSSLKEILEEVEAQGASECFKQEQVVNDFSESILQQQTLEQHRAEENARDPPVSSSKSNLSNATTEVIHPGGILHVLLDVHKEGIADESLPKNIPVQDYVKMIETEGAADAQISNTDDITGGANVGEGCLGTYVSGSAGHVTASGSHEDSCPSQEKSCKKKADSSSRNNRIKDSGRASPLQARSDQEQKKGGPEGLGRRKATPKKCTPQKKGIEPMEDFTSPSKTTSRSTSGKKKVLLSKGQDAEGSPAVKEGSQAPPSIGKSVSVSARHLASADLNGLETSVPVVSPSQPFSEPQQVQLRAQILVYGSLIQGVAPEEVLMVAAFSNVIGGQVGKDSETSERAVWEKHWQAAVDRIHAKNSRDLLKDPSRENTALVSNFPITTVKAAEGGLKANGSSCMVDGRGAAGLLTQASEASGPKGQALRPRQSGNTPHNIPVSRSMQPIVAAATLGSIITTASRSLSSCLSENLSLPAKPCTDSQQMTPQTYFPTPPLGPFITGASQWFSNASYPGSWIPQTQAAGYGNPPALFTHAQAAVSSDIAPDTRKSTPSSSGTIMPVSAFGTTIVTPAMGGLSVIPTAIANLSQNKQAVPESRPRKRKKIHSESYGPSADVNSSYLSGTAPGLSIPAASIASHMQTGPACLGISSAVYLPPLSAPEALALVVPHTQSPKSSQETSLVTVHANKASAPSTTNMPRAGLLSIENFFERSANLQNTTNHLSQAQASAEEAASAAASALRESESVWSQLKAQRNAGLILDRESQLVSSAIAVSTAAVVAKAAAAAAKAAYEAAVQAKKISEGGLEVGKQGDGSAASRPSGDRADISPQVWELPERSNSTLAAAKMASKQRLEAVSAARFRAENFESVVRAAELATNAITQVGSIMAMGESVPFTLDVLLEAGSEGLHKLEERVNAKPKSKALRSPRRAGTPKLIDREKKISLNIGSGKEVASQRDVQLDNWTSDARISTDLGVGLLTEISKHTATDHLALSVPAPRQGLLTPRTEGGQVEKEVLFADDKIVKGSLVEVMSDEKGLHGAWFSARVRSVDNEKVFVLYDDLLADDGYSPLEEWIQLKGSSGKAPRVRLAHPNTNISFEGTRKRRREAMGSHKCSVGDRVDAWIRDGWWEGEIKEIIEDGESKAKVFFPEDGDTSMVKTSKLRPSLVWSNGHWILWTDAKEGDTPLAKRQRTEKAQTSRQRLVPGIAVEASLTHKESSPFDSGTANLPTDGKGFSADGGIAKPKQQGSKVVFGVPRPTKKRKLIEVSKHFGVSGKSGFADAEAGNNKTEGALVYAPGSFDASRLDTSKAKNRVLHHPKARYQRETDSDIKANGIRSKKEKAAVVTKTLVQKITANKEGLPSASKNKEGKVIKKKVLPSDNTQLESQEQVEDRALANVANLETDTPSIAVDIGEETPLAAQSKEKPNDGFKDGEKEPSQGAQETAGLTGLSKGKDKQSSALASRIESTSQSSKRKETQPSKDNEEVAHKGKQSQPSHQGGKRLEVSSKKPPSNPIKDGEKQPSQPIKEPEKKKVVGKSASETWEPRRTSRKIQPTSKLLEGLQTAPKLGKSSSSHDRGNRGGLKAPAHP